MPMPPLLDTINWQATFDAGLNFTQWLELSDDTKREKITAAIESISIPQDIVAQLSGLTKSVHVIAIAEDWCGDVLRHVPVLEALAKQSEHIHTRYIAREPHKEIFVRYLTNGGEAIPKFIFLSDTFTECGNWGPMPQRYKDLISRGKGCGDVPSARAIIHNDYTSGNDRPHTIAELTTLINTAGAVSVT